MSDKTYTVIKYRRGRKNEVTDTLANLRKYFGYTLEAGASYNPKINTEPRTVKGLVSALNKSVDELQCGSFDPDFYEVG